MKGRVVGFLFVSVVAAAVLTDGEVAGAVDEGDWIYVSSSSSGRVGDVSFDDEDIIAYEASTGTWSLLFDGSDVGLADSADIDALHVVHDDDPATPVLIYLSLQRPRVVDGLRVDDSDILLFTPTSLGADTAGSFVVYFDGSDVGLQDSSEDIDGFAITSDGDLLVSTRGFTVVPRTERRRVVARDEDLLRFEPDTLGNDTAGTWSRYFDGSDVGLRAPSERVWGVSSGVGDDLLLTISGPYRTGGLSGDGDDIVAFIPDALGGRTAGSFALFFDGDDHPGLERERLDVVSVAMGAAPNAPPTAVDDGPGPGFATDEDTGFTTESVLENDTDPDLDTLIVESVDTTGTIGSVTDNGDGTFVYDPSGGFDALAVGESLDDTFTYVVADGRGGTDTATVIVTVDGVNDPPTAADDVASTDEDTATRIDVLANDTDIDGDSLRIVQVHADEILGTVSVRDDGSTLEYDPDGQFEQLAAGETTQETFGYVVEDGNGGVASAMVTITILGVDDANTDPVANPDRATTDEDTVAGHIFAMVIGDVEPGGFTRPRGVAVDSETGNIIVADEGKHRVVVYDGAGVPTGTIIDDLRYPYGVAVDPRNGNILVADTYQSRVAVYDRSGSPTGVVIPDLVRPRGVAVDPATGSVVVAETEADRVVVFDSAGVPTGVVITDLAFPSGVAVDPASGNIVVADSGNDRVVVFDSAGVPTGVVITDLDFPSGVAVDPATGNIVVADTRNDRVLLSDATGVLLDIVTDGLDSPYGVAVDPASGNFLVGDSGNDRVVVFDGAGSETGLVIAEPADINDASGVAVDPFTGNLVVADYSDDRVVVYDSAGTFTGLVIDGLRDPEGVAVDPTTGNIVVADTGNDRVPVFDAAGIPTGLVIDVDDPYGVAVGPTGDIVVGVPTGWWLFDGTGTPLWFDNDFFLVLDVAVDPATGNIILASPLFQEVYVYGAGPSIFVNSPDAVGVDPTTGNIVVGDAVVNRVLTFDPSGTPTGPVIAGLFYPNGLAVDGSGRIVVADYGRVVVFGTNVLDNDSDPDGDVLTVTGFDATSAEGATVVVDAAGTYTYDPTTSATIQALGRFETLVDTFSYTISDGNGGTDTATVTVTVTALGE